MKTIKTIALATLITLTTTSNAFAGNIPTGISGNMPTGRTLTDIVLGLLSIVY